MFARASFVCCIIMRFFVFCLSVVLVRLSVPVHVIDWKDSSPKWPIMMYACVHICSRSKNLECWDPTHWQEGVADPRETCLSLFDKFGHSRSNNTSIIMEIARKLWPLVLPFKVTQGHRNYSTDGYPWLPISDLQYPWTYRKICVYCGTLKTC